MTSDQLERIAIYAKHTDVILYAPLLSRYMKEYQITGKEREAAFIATIIHESGSFKYTKEIASGSAYEGRKDLGNVIPGDGVKFKGRGLIQITGRSNYTAISKAFGIDFVNKPELLELPEWAARSACWWWKNNGLNEIADSGDMRRVTRRVNGGYNGLPDRVKWYNLAKQVL